MILAHIKSLVSPPKTSDRLAASDTICSRRDIPMMKNERILWNFRILSWELSAFGADGWHPPSWPCDVNLTPAYVGSEKPDASDLHGLGERGTGGQSVCAESARVAAAPVVNDVALPGAPQHAHHGLLESLHRVTRIRGVRKNSHNLLYTHGMKSQIPVVWI